MKSDWAKVVMANSITLTPGTVTLDISGGEYVIHAICQKTADGVLDGEMLKRDAYLFKEEP
jgi:multicomponent Na+:H+ antiporter subunit E